MKKGTFKTRHALLLSLLSLTTCFAMLLGTTFAWFTDSVTSGVNHIIAGNLDVELVHQEMVNGVFSGTDSKVDPTTELFKVPATATSPMLWEPGAKAVEKFVVKNVGNLAFKYDLKMFVAGYNTVDGTKSLKDVIKVAVTDSEPAADTALTWQDLSTFTTTGAIQSGGTDKTFYVVLYWAPNDNDVDNIYNLNNGRTAKDGSNKLTIDLGVTLVATQDTVEYDSFSNTYDATATYPAVITATTVSAAYDSTSNTSIGNIANDNAAATVEAATTVYSDNNTTNEITGVDSLALQVKPTTEAAATTAATSSITVTGTENVDYYDISLVATDSTTGTETEVKSTSAVVKVEINLGTGLSNVKVNHKGTDMLTTGDTGYAAGAANTFTYNATTGILTLYLTSFSPFAIGYDAPGAAIGGIYYKTLEAAWDAANDGDTITLLKDSAGNGIKAPQGKFGTTGLTVDFGGHTYTMDGTMVGSTGTETQAFQLLKDNKITFKNGTITSAKAKMLVQNYSNLTLKNMTLTLNNANYAYGYTLSNNNGNIVIDDTTINANPAGGFAFDVCRYSSYPSVSVELKGSSVINGNIEIDVGSNDPKDGLTLKLTAGTVNGELKPLSTLTNALNGSNAGKVSITKAADFAIDAPSGFIWAENNTKLALLVISG